MERRNKAHYGSQGTLKSTDSFKRQLNTHLFRLAY